MGRAVRAPKLERMTVEDFLAWDGGGHEGKLELVDGEVRAMAPASATHAMIQTNLAVLIANHLRAKKSKCRVLVEAPIQPRLDARHNLRAPDLGVTCKSIGEEKVLPEPILLIEVLSPGNSNLTRANVWTYATIPSVREIVLVYSTRVRAEVYRRDEGGAWPTEAEVTAKGETLNLTSISQAVPLGDAYEGTHLA